ncbi:TetR/AcrR family transcriptional regulator [Paracoccus pacificus]|uniref:TetR/AcrR family transcriptional regulator n=1 Tax=Paracoccus pacificus TaxID=1463598 RepID=A0ABW4RC55_9RHOB
MRDEAPVNRGRKFQQVIHGARRVFLRDGFEGASVDEIARVAGVSKATLYSYFPDKRLMFLHVFREELANCFADSSMLLTIEAPPEVILPAVMRLVADHITSDQGVSIYRVCIGEAARFPEIAKAYHDAGPKRLCRHLACYLQGAVDRGELIIPDVEIAAAQLLELAAIEIRNTANFQGPTRVNPERMEEICRAGMQMFMSCYGAANAMRHPPSRFQGQSGRS